MTDITRAEYDKDISRIDEKNSEQDKRLGKAEKELILLGESFRGIIELPDRVQRIDIEVAKTNTLLTTMSANIDTALMKTEENSEELDVQKKRGVVNIDVLKLLTDNFLKICGSGSILYLIYEVLTKGV